MTRNPATGSGRPNVRPASSGIVLLAALFAPTVPSSVRMLPAVGILRRIWLCKYVVIEGAVRLRDAKGLRRRSRRGRLRIARARYRGTAETHLHHVGTAVAINLRRVADWLREVPHVQTRRSHFAPLALVA